MNLIDNKGVVHLTDATEDMCFSFINKYAKSKDLGFYFRSHLLENGNIWVDYGSHSHFFEISKNG